MDTHPSRVVDLLPALMRYARRLTRDEHDAEDLVQEALVAACANADKYQPGRPLRVWMFAIVHNRFVSRRRRDAVRARYDASEIACDTGPAAQEQSIRLREVAEAVGRLSAEQQQVLHLVAVEGLSYQEAADAVGIPIGTLISRLSRARARLRALDDDEPAGRAAGSLRIVEN